MQEPTFLVLTTLAGPPLHGYGIMQAVAELSDGTVTIRPGTLYAALDRLTGEGVVEVAREEHTSGGRLRRYYQLTPHGSQMLHTEAQHRRRLAGIAVRRLSALGGPSATAPVPHPA
ncbi:PadR family transcriptional regulator [Micromonospora polyrhachis]|nr:helix-turn-helix transcriptional regulator [Micromonospora polyrhachis]